MSIQEFMIVVYQKTNEYAQKIKETQSKDINEYSSYLPQNPLYDGAMVIRVMNGL